MSDPSTTRRYRSLERRDSPITIEEAVAWFDDSTAGRDAAGYLYSPAAARFVARSNGVWQQRDAGGVEAADFGPAFEVTLFTAERELRWTHSGFGKGAAVIVSDREADEGAVRLLSGVREHLLWGYCSAQIDGWVSTDSARIGPLWVPFGDPIDDGDWLVLTGVEYTETDEHGNVFVVDRRHIGIEKRSPERGKRV